MARSTKKKASWVRRIGAGVFVLALAAGIVVAWMPRAISVDLAVASKGPIAVTVDEDGRTRVKDRYIISAPLAATLARPEVTAGDQVKEGEVVARLVPLASPLLDPRSRATAEARVAVAQAALKQAEATIARARAAKEFADREVERQRKLRAQGAVAQDLLDRAELEARTRSEELTSVAFGARVSAHELEMARAALGRMGRGGAAEEQLEVKAPVSGIVLKVIKESEGAVQPGEPLLELGDPTKLEVVVDVLTADAVKIKPGARVIIDRWGGGNPLAAHVREVEPSAFTRVSALGVEEQRVNVLIDLDEPVERWAGLGDGFRVEAKIVVDEAQEALQVPLGAVFKAGEGWAVYRVIEETAQLVPVEVARRSERTIEILRGLEAGDRVVQYPSDRLADGVAVRGR